jgi:hypothetical protein
MQSEATAANHSSSCAHDDILAKCDEKGEIKGQDEDLGFEHDKRSTSEDQGANMFSEGYSTSGAHTDALVTTPKDQQDKKSKSGDPVGKPVQPVSKTGPTGFHGMNTTRSSKCSRRRSRKTPTVSRSSTLSVDNHKCLMAKKSKETKDNQMTKRIGDQVDTIKTLTQKLQAFKLSHSTLVNKYDILLNKVTCATNSSTCVASLEQEEKVLSEKLEKLTSEHMALQARHKELECSHEMLVESYTRLEIAHEVVLSSVTSTQPLSHTCTCSHVNIELSGTKLCCSQASQSSIEHVFVETCDDLIAKETDQLMQEVERLKDDLSKLKGKIQVQPCQDNHDNMVKKLEKGSNRTSSILRSKKQGKNHKAQEIKKKELDHIQCFKCSKMGHYASMCSSQLKNNKKRQGKLRRRICYKCKQNGNFIGDCPQVIEVLFVPNRSDRVGKPVRPVLATMAPQVHIKRNQASSASLKIKKEQVSKNKCKASARKIKIHIC